MTRFMMLYKGAAMDPASMSQEAAAAEMAKWVAWGQKTGPALVDWGTPFGVGISVVDDGSSATPVPLSGYSIVEAADLDAAAALAVDHPYLAEGSGNFAVEIFEMLPVPGMG
jgi:hypothetical protein